MATHLDAEATALAARIHPAAMRRLVILRDAYLVAKGTPVSVAAGDRYRDALTLIALQLGARYDDVNAAVAAAGG